jgi:hypothetical protein
MFYFRRSPFYTTDLKELSQFRKVVQFRKELEKMGILFWEYERPIDFERSVREHLIRQILPMVPPGAAPRGPSGGPKKPPRKPTSDTGSPAGRKPMIFLAYSHRDRRLVTRLYEDLRLAGFNPWLDIENLLPGERWHVTIDHAMKESDAIVVCLSSNSVSRKGFFQRELKTALEQFQSRPQGHPFLIPVRFDNVSVPAAIGMFQYLDYFHPDGAERLANMLRSLRKDAE